MKKYWKVLLLAAGIGIFAACEDVPEPYNIPTGNNANNTVAADSLGAGTLEDPFNAAAAIAAVQQLPSGQESAKDYFIKGVITIVDEAFSTQYGNGTFTIADSIGETKNTFKAYRVAYLGNKKFTDADTNVQVGDTVIIYGRITNFKGNTPETVQNKAFLYSLNGEDRGGIPEPTEAGEPKGTGTLEDPFNGAAANAAASALAADAKSEQAYYIKGKVVSIREQFSSNYGNASFYISDDGSTTGQFLVYRSLYLGNKKWVEGNAQLKEGDEVIVYAKLTNYKGDTPETVQNETYLYSLNGETTGGDNPEPQPSGDWASTAAAPLSVAKVLELSASLEPAAQSPVEVYVKGKISQIDEVSTQYGNATYFISDDGTTNGQLEVFRGKYLGGANFTSEDQIKVGDEVIVFGYIKNYVKDNVSTIEFNQGNKIYSLNGETAGDDPGSIPGEEGNSITFSDKGYGNAQDFDGKTITLGDATLAFSKGSGSTTPKYYTTGTAMRLYGGNTLTISSSKDIAKVEFTYGEDYGGNSFYPTADNSEITPAGYNYETHVWTGSAKEIVLSRTASTGHFRIISITITYVE